MQIIVTISVDNEAFGAAELHTINPDGTGDRLVAPGRFRPGFDWDPSGRYFVARSDQGYLAVIDVTAGTVLPLGWSGPYLAAAWRP